MTHFKFLSAIAATFVSLVAAHAVHADCITQGEANVQVRIYAEQVIGSGTAEETLPAPFLDGYEMNFTGGDVWLDACHANEVNPADHGFQVGGFVQGLIRQKYESLNGSLSFLSWPVSNEEETTSSNGRVSFFEGQFTDGTPDGAIYWSPASGAFSMHGIIFQQFEDYNQTASGLGYPLSDERACMLAGCRSGGRENVMQNGFMEFAPTSGIPTQTDAAWAVFNVPNMPQGSSHLSVSNLTPLGQSIAELQIVGNGFAPNQHVQVFLNTPSGRSLQTTVTTSSVGGFELLDGVISTSGIGNAAGNEVIGTIEASGAGIDAVASTRLR